MADLVPLPFSRLVTRLFRELDEEGALFHLPKRKFYRGASARSFAVSHHGGVASTPVGPAAGPHTQLAQNIVLSFLGGARIFELKTVQVLDQLRLPRPCIDVETIGYNVEWSQELRLDQSLEEYVKASMLIDILVASGRLGLAPADTDCLFDMSVGYDLAGVKSETMRRFLAGMVDASPIVDRLRGEIPETWGKFRDLSFRTRISDSVTLSTFHGCPPGEIEQIARFMLEELGLGCVVKLNPTLLGRQEVRRLLHDHLGYDDLPPDEAFDKDATWDQAAEFVARLGDRAAALGRGFGVKFSNTLIVENHRKFFPDSEKVMYLSGQPLHVLAMNLVGRFRQAFADRFTVSFSGGIDQKNFADAVSLGLVPVTVCTDLLRTGGYARLEGYLRDLGSRMDAVGAKSLSDFILLGQGNGDAALAAAGAADGAIARWAEARASGGDLRDAVGGEYDRAVSAARLLNTTAYIEKMMADGRYARPETNRPPKKVGSKLALFDCLTCDKCIPVCPNDANFTLELPPFNVPIVTLNQAKDGAWTATETGTLRTTKKHQIANFADFCNECGNCDIFCPEDGGPYLIKPRFFGSLGQFETHAAHDGFYVERAGEGLRVWSRFAGRVYRAAFESERTQYAGDGFEVACDTLDPSRNVSGRADSAVDLTYLAIMREIGRAVMAKGAVNYVNL